jgi:hypothetical protein
VIDLDAITARAEAATPGPWAFDAERFVPSDPAIGVYWVWEIGAGKVLILGGVGGEDDPGADLAFACAARTDVPALVAEVERLSEDKETALRVIAHLWKQSGCSDPAHPQWANSETSLILSALADG